MWSRIAKTLSRSFKSKIKELEGEVIPTEESIQKERLTETIQEVSINEFTYLNVSGIVDVIITPGEVLSLRVEADPHVDDKIGEIVRQQGKNLYLSTPNNPETNNQWKYLRVIISGPNIKLKHIIAMGVTKLVIDDLRTSDITIETSGVSTVMISGSANESRILCSGCSVFDGEGFITNKSSVDTEGTSKATVNVKDSLIAAADGVS